MGVTLRRAGLGVLALAAVLLPLRGPKREAVVRPDDNRAVRLFSLVNRARTANYLWSALELRDTALSVIATNAATGEGPLIEARGFAGKTGEVEAIAAGDASSLWKKIGPTDSEVSIAIVIENPDRYRSNGYLGTLISRRDGHLWCVAIAAASASVTGRMQVWGHSFEESLAPCTFFAAFGVPGAGVGSWLATTRYASVQSDNWLTRPRNFHDTEGPWARWYQPDATFRSPHPLLWSALGSLDFTTLLIPPYEFGATGLRCVTGDESACVQAVLRPSIEVPGHGEFPAELSVQIWKVAPDTVTLSTVRPPISSYASAMIADFGRTRFRQFWKSNRSIEAAFQDAFGEPLGAWTARWAAREWQASFLAKYRGQEILLGVTLQPSWPFLVIAWSGVAVLIAAGVAKRRTT